MKFEIRQAPRQRRCRDACQILSNTIIIALSLEVSRLQASGFMVLQLSIPKNNSHNRHMVTTGTYTQTEIIKQYFIFF